MNLVDIFLLLVFSPFSFNWLSFLEHMLFWLLIVSGDNSYYIDWHIVGFKQFRWCHGIKTNMFSSEHVMYLKFYRALSRSMFYDKINYTRIMNMYFSWFIRLGFCPYYIFYRFNCSNWHNIYLSFPSTIGFHLMTDFTTIGIG
jgi:hypothetical protein